MNTMKKIMTVFGTRPEAIKMCPLIKELRSRDIFDTRVVLTGQHREMLLQVMEAFDIKEDHNLDIMRTSQSLEDITAGVLTGMKDILDLEQPDLVLVHGDTTTSFCAALAAFYKKIPVGHVEAGLRTGNIYSPFPEEMNRTLTGRIAALHFSPTENNRKNLEKEGINKGIYVTGNTVIDAFATTIRPDHRFANKDIRELDERGILSSKRVILLTAHRRENLGSGLENICSAILDITREFPDVHVIYPVHLNPAVRDTVFKMLGDNDCITLTDPVDVLDMHNLMSRSYLVMTDSGGLQEEAPALGKPVLVLRRETERPEAVEAGTVKVSGIEGEAIYSDAGRLLSDIKAYETMAKAVNPYGDGHASERICDIIAEC